MGVQITLLFPHHLVAWSDRSVVLDTLAKTLPAARLIAACAWGRCVEEGWTAERSFPFPYTREYSRFSGPGAMFVEVNPHAVCVSPSARWRGFLRIQPLRSVHLGAFELLLRAFGAPSGRCFPEDDIVEGAFWEGADFPTCCQLLDQRYGEPVPLVDGIDPELASLAEHGCPLIQYALQVPA